jgi:hypothetical protein
MVKQTTCNLLVIIYSSFQRTFFYMKTPIRLVIVDDHPALHFGLVALFQSEPDFTVPGEASNGLGAIEKALS